MDFRAILNKVTDPEVKRVTDHLWIQAVGAHERLLVSLSDDAARDQLRNIRRDLYEWGRAFGITLEEVDEVLEAALDSARMNKGLSTRTSPHPGLQSAWESKMSVEELVKKIEQGADPKTVVEGYMVPNLEVGNRVLVQGLPSPLSGKVIALKEDGDLCTIETEKGTMDVPARHLVKQEGRLKQEYGFTSLPIQNFLFQNGFTFNGTKGHFDEWVATRTLGGNPAERIVIEVGPIWGEGGELATEIEGWQIFVGGRPLTESGIGVAALRDEFERQGWL